MKRKTSILLSIVMVLMMVTPVLADINLDVNGRAYEPSSKVYVENDLTLVTLDVVANTLGCEVTTNDDLIKITENDNVLEMTLGSTAAILNGVEKTMPKAPEVINGETYIPLRFVFEALGSVVDWLGENKTAAITYNETREGMTPEELMAKSSAAMTETGRYKMVVDMQSAIDATVKEAGKDAENMKMDMDSNVEAWLQMDPIVMYLKQTATMNVPEAPNTPAAQAIETEMLMNEDGIFMTMPEVGWVKMNMEGLDIKELMKQSMAQDPAAAMQQIKDMGMSLSFANDQERNGKQYWVLNCKMGGDIFKSDYFKQVSQQMPTLTQDEVDLQKALEEMDLDFVYSLWIDKETLYNDYMDLAGNMKFNMDIPATEESQGGTMDMAMDMKASYIISDYGEEFSTPEVKNARDFEEVIAEQMAASQPEETIE